MTWKYKFGRIYRKKQRSKIEIINSDSSDSSDNSSCIDDGINQHIHKKLRIIYPNYKPLLLNTSFY